MSVAPSSYTGAMPQLELVCPVCSNREFREEEGRVPAGIGHHRLTMMICTQCNYVMPFYKKRTTL
jgi:predicted nucleic-acid-binding Zn-ribbon protein